MVLEINMINFCLKIINIETYFLLQVTLQGIYNVILLLTTRNSVVHYLTPPLPFQSKI